MNQPESFADLVIKYHDSLDYKEPLPEGFYIMNPFRNNPEGLRVFKLFYRKFYPDRRPRKLMLGINPGRFGAGVTGVPFTDTKRLSDICGIPYLGKGTHEPSATFVYQMIETYGGVAAFYRDIYIHSIFPLAIVRRNEKDHLVNCNYYDDPRLWEALKPFMAKHLKEQIQLGLLTDTLYILGKKNAQYVTIINEEYQLFEKIEILEHPRYIQQYKSKEAATYAQKFVQVLKGA